MPHQPCTGALRANSLRDVHLRTAPAGRTSVSGVISLGSNGPPASVAETYWISSQAQLKGTGEQQIDQTYGNPAPVLDPTGDRSSGVCGSPIKSSDQL